MKKKNNNNKEDNQEGKWSKASKIIDGIIYVAVILVIVFWQIFPNLFPNLKIEYILISILLLFGASYLHTILSINSVKQQVSKIDLTDVMSYDYLHNIIVNITDGISEVDKLKICDLTGKDFLQIFNDKNLKVQECWLYIKDIEQVNNQAVADEINDSVNAWNNLQTQGKIKRLHIEKFSSNPTEFFCIFDDKFLISGFVRSDLKKTDDPNVLFVDITSRKGHKYIQQYSDKFDSLIAESYKSAPPNKNNNIFLFNNRNDEEQKALLNAELRVTKSVIAIGIANTEMTANLPNGFYKDFFVNKSGDMKLMFLNPDGDAIKRREEDEEVGAANGEYTFASVVRYNINKFLDGIKSVAVAPEAEITPLNYALKIYDFYPKINCIITDNYVFFHYYGFKHCGTSSPSFVVKKEGNEESYAYYKHELLSYWEKAQDYKGITK